MQMGIPYIHICCALHFDFSGSTPAPLFNWPHDTTPEALTRNVHGLQQIGEILRPVLEEAIPYADRNGLQINWQEPGSTLSKLAVITQVPKESIFPASPCRPTFTTLARFTRTKAASLCLFRGNY